MPKWRGALDRGAIVALPALTVVVTVAGLVLGRERPFVYARGRGGPTLGARELSCRLEVLEHTQEGDRPWRGPVRVEVGASTDFARLVPDDEGALELGWEPTAPVDGPIRVRIDSVTEPEKPGGVPSFVPITSATVVVARGPWARGGPSPGTWVTRKDGGLTISAAAKRGVFAVPFEDVLLVKVQSDGSPAPGAEIAATSEGAEVRVDDARTDDHGVARARVRPLLHEASVTVEARAPSGRRGRLVVTLPVVPGAIRVEAKRTSDDATSALEVRSPIVRQRAHLAFVTEHERVRGLTVELRPEPGGGAQSVLSDPDLLRWLDRHPPLWVVASSEADFSSAGTVGWPIETGSEPWDPDVPSSTFDARDVPWFDGLPAALAREAARTRRARTLAAIATTALLAVTALLVARRYFGAAHVHDEVLGRTPTTRMVGLRRHPDWFVLGALLCLALAVTMMVVLGRL